MVAVHGGEVRGEVPLSVGGIMSGEELSSLAPRYRSLCTLLREMGCAMSDPLFGLGFITLSGIPYCRMTPEGVYDVLRREVVW